MNPLLPQADFPRQSVPLTFPTQAGSPVTSSLLCHPDVLGHLQIPEATQFHYTLADLQCQVAGCGPGIYCTSTPVFPVHVDKQSCFLHSPGNPPGSPQGT